MDNSVSLEQSWYTIDAAFTDLCRSLHSVFLTYDNQASLSDGTNISFEKRDGHIFITCDLRFNYYENTMQGLLYLAMNEVPGDGITINTQDVPYGEVELIDHVGSTLPLPIRMGITNRLKNKQSNALEQTYTYRHDNEDKGPFHFFINTNEEKDIFQIAGILQQADLYLRNKLRSFNKEN